jgi:hypothetical protein
MIVSSTARGQESDYAGHRFPLHGAVDVSFFLAALQEPGPPQDVEVVRQGRPGDLHGFLDFADRHLPAGLYEGEKDLETADVRERLERLDMRLVG